jgi:hypothetical protein
LDAPATSVRARLSTTVTPGMVDGLTSADFQSGDASAALTASKLPWDSPHTWRKASKAGEAATGPAAAASSAPIIRPRNGFMLSLP